MDYNIATTINRGDKGMFRCALILLFFLINLKLVSNIVSPYNVDDYKHTINKHLPCSGF